MNRDERNTCDEQNRRGEIAMITWRLVAAYLSGKLSAEGIDVESLRDNSPALKEVESLYKEEAELLLSMLDGFRAMDARI